MHQPWQLEPPFHQSQQSQEEQWFQPKLQQQHHCYHSINITTQDSLSSKMNARSSTQKQSALKLRAETEDVKTVTQHPVGLETSAKEELPATIDMQNPSLTKSLECSLLKHCGVVKPFAHFVFETLTLSI